MLLWSVGVEALRIHLPGLSAAGSVRAGVASAPGSSAIMTCAALAPPVEANLTFALCGQAEMTIRAVVAGADPAFVIVYHLTRIILVIAGVPVVARLIPARRRRR